MAIRRLVYCALCQSSRATSEICASVTQTPARPGGLAIARRRASAPCPAQEVTERPLKANRPLFLRQRPGADREIRLVGQVVAVGVEGRRPRPFEVAPCGGAVAPLPGGDPVGREAGLDQQVLQPPRAPA